jgi:hypothetical protein
MGPVYDGMLHFLTSPEDLVPAVALALLGAAWRRSRQADDVHAADGLAARRPGRIECG